MSRAGFCLVALGAGCVFRPGEDPRPPDAGLLAGRKPSRAAQTSSSHRVTDGIAPEEGDAWRTGLTSVIRSGGALEWDLGKVEPLACAAISADGNDRYAFLTSDDGVTFRVLWEAPPADSGMRLRSVRDLGGSGRFVRIEPRGGDGRYSVGEVVAHAVCPTAWPPALARRRGAPDEDQARTDIWLFGALGLLFVVLRARPAGTWTWLLGTAFAVSALKAATSLGTLWPDAEPVLPDLRAVAAGLGAAIVLREAFPRRGRSAATRGNQAMLAVLAVAAVASYFHLGAPQFRDESKGRGTFVHPWDMRVYFPLAKYFPELRFDGLYLASVAAHLDNDRSESPRTVWETPLRDLRDSEVRRGRELMNEIDAVRDRFSPERWEAFRKDMRYFEALMGPGGYLGSLTDHGGNATPVWLLAAHLIFRDAEASELTLTLSGLIDPVLLVLLFVAIGRSYGRRAALVTLLLFGATDFGSFGTNLTGSTLRADWMVALGLGACALKTGRSVLGGALLAHAGLIRAFPSLAALFLLAPPLIWLCEVAARRRRWPSLRELRAAHPWMPGAVAGAAATVVLLATLASLGPLAGGWRDWADKIAIHAEEPSTNNVGLRNLLGFEPSHTGEHVHRPDLADPWSDWQRYQRDAITRRRPVQWAATAAFTGLVLAACRRRRPEQAALLGLFLVPVLFYPSNYYFHYVFLLPLAVPDDRRGTGRLFAWTAGCLLALCVAQVPTLAAAGDICYTIQSALLLAAFAAILVPLARDACGPGDGRPAGQPAATRARPTCRPSA